MESEVPTSFMCPVCKVEHPADSFKSSVDQMAVKVTPRNIHFTCSEGQLFNLRNAIDSGMFTKDQTNNLIRNAQITVDRNRIKRLVDGAIRYGK